MRPTAGRDRRGALALALLCLAGASARSGAAARSLSWHRHEESGYDTHTSTRALALAPLLRGGEAAEEATEGGVKPLGPAHAAFLQTFEHFLEAFAAALEKACTHDKGGLFGARTSKRAHLKPDRAAMQQAYNHMHDCYTSGLLGARSPQHLVLCAMQVRRGLAQRVLPPPMDQRCVARSPCTRGTADALLCPHARPPASSHASRTALSPRRPWLRASSSSAGRRRRPQSLRR